MSLLIIIGAILILANITLYVFNQVSSTLRGRNTQKMFLKDKIKVQLLDKISELNGKLKGFEENHVQKKQYLDLVHKYNLLLNQYRENVNKTKSLKMRIKKLKDKIY